MKVKMEHHYIDVPFLSNFNLAGVEGLEPSQAVLETDVLPLTLYSYKNYFLIITQKKENDNTFYKFFQNGDGSFFKKKPSPFQNTSNIRLYFHHNSRI